MPTTVRFGFQCPACMAGRWDYAPSKPGSLTSPEASRIASPSTVSGIVTPAGKTANTGHLTPIAQLLTHGPPFTPDHGVPVDAFDPSILSRARDFLRANGDFPESQEYSVELLIKLGGMMSELDFHRRRTQELLSENAHLRQDNANIRAYLDSNLVTGKPSAPVSDLSHIPRPSSDTTGKSWDRIVMDLI
ncbi:hypothetical protein BDW74DRAFT_147575 [Aspergillus multicolor]|uniref:PHD finger protein n=1 Tax=Aspergillus multicolor TaxID=41759 RepID=UPI003CCDF435